MRMGTQQHRLVQVSYLNLMFNILFIFYCGGALSGYLRGIVGSN